MLGNSTIKRKPLPEKPLVPSSSFFDNSFSIAEIKWKMPTLNGFAADEVISAFQKCIRRGLEEESLQWGFELFWTANIAREKIWSRILVISVEDVGIADSSALLKVGYLYENFKTDPQSFAAAISLLCKTRKCRLNDWVTKLEYQLEKQENANAIVDSSGGLDKIRSILVESLRNKDSEKALYCLKVLSFTNQKHPSYENLKLLIFDVFEEVIGKSDYLSALKKIAFFPVLFGAPDTRLYDIHVVHLWCNNIFPESAQFEKIEMNPEYLKISEKVQKRDETLLGIPEFAIDKHTTEGKKIGKGMIHFVETGTILVNEEEKWKNLSYLYQERFVDECRKEGIYQ